MEELSDIYWFTAAICKATGTGEYLDTDVYDAHATTSESELQRLVHDCVCDIMDLAKRQLFYGPSVNLERWETSLLKLQPQARRLEALVQRLVEANVCEPSKIMMLNIAKLAKRYADKFSDQEANIRNINAEYEAMGAK
jgi:hypothetical protein